MTWIRWDTGTPSSDLVGDLAEALHVELAQALGHYTAVCCLVGEHQPDGQLGGVTDSTLEQWALWRGKAGRFAGAFRARCLDGEGQLRGWWRQESLIRKREADKCRVKAARQSKEHPATPERTSGAVQTPTDVHTDERTDEHSTTTARDAVREGLASQPDAWAVFEGGYRAAHSPFAFAAAFRALGPGGAHEAGSWADFATGLVEAAAVAGGLTPNKVTAFIRSARQRRETPTQARPALAPAAPVPHLRRL